MRRFSLALLAGGFVALAAGNAVRADNDTVRLATSSSGVGTGPSGGTDTELVHSRGGYRHHGYGGYHGGYHRGYFGGYHRGYYGGYYGYNRPYYGGYYARPYYGGYYGGYYSPSYYSGYSPYYYGSYCQPYYNGGYYGQYYGYYGGYRRISLNGDISEPYGVALTVSAPITFAQAPALAAQPATRVYQNQPQLLPAPAAGPGNNQTFPYDGGPSVPLPLPPSDAAPPSVNPQPTIPLSGKVVSVPGTLSGGTTQYTNMLIGWTAVATQPASAPATSRFSYPAYGDQPLPQVRKLK